MKFIVPFATLIICSAALWIGVLASIVLGDPSIAIVTFIAAWCTSGITVSAWVLRRRPEARALGARPLPQATVRQRRR